MLRILFSMIALFVRIELLRSSIPRLPPNKANGVAVFGGSPIRYNKASLQSPTVVLNLSHVLLFI